MKINLFNFLPRIRILKYSLRDKLEKFMSRKGNLFYLSFIGRSKELKYQLDVL